LAPQRSAKVARIALSLALVAICVWALATHVDPAVLGRALRGTNYWLVLVMTAGHLFLLLPIKSWRWQLMLRPMQHVPVRTLYRYCLAGCAVSNALPARAGHAVRVVLLRRHGVPAPGAASVLLLEETFNAAVLGLLCAALPFSLALPGKVRWMFGLITVGALIGVALAAWVARRSATPRPGFWGKLASGLGFLRDGKIASAALGLTLAMWLIDVGQILLALAAVGLPARWLTATLVLLFVNLTNAVPATPGQVGLFEAASMAACMTVGATAEQGLAVGVLYHMMQFLPETAWGAWILLRDAAWRERAGAVG
jgi:uncharacterized membrane protein YbhN (UPF0104 family)